VSRATSARRPAVGFAHHRRAAGVGREARCFAYPPPDAHREDAGVLPRGRRAGGGRGGGEDLRAPRGPRRDGHLERAPDQRVDALRNGVHGGVRGEALHVPRRGRPRRALPLAPLAQRRPPRAREEERGPAHPRRPEVAPGATRSPAVGGRGGGRPPIPRPTSDPTPRCGPRPYATAKSVWRRGCAGSLRRRRPRPRRPLGTRVAASPGCPARSDLAGKRSDRCSARSDLAGRRPDRFSSRCVPRPETARASFGEVRLRGEALRQLLREGPTLGEAVRAVFDEVGRMRRDVRR